MQIRVMSLLLCCGALNSITLEFVNKTGLSDACLAVAFFDDNGHAVGNQPNFMDNKKNGKIEIEVPEVPHKSEQFQITNSNQSEVDPSGSNYCPLLQSPDNYNSLLLSSDSIPVPDKNSKYLLNDAQGHIRLNVAISN